MKFVDDDDDDADDDRMSCHVKGQLLTIQIRDLFQLILHAMKSIVADVSYVKPVIFCCICSYCDFYFRTMCSGEHRPSFLTGLPQ